MNKLITISLVQALLYTATLASPSPQCSELSPGFHASGVNRTVNCMLRVPTQDGDLLYVGGSFTTAGKLPVKHLALWNGSDWSPVGSGPSNVPLSLALYDDGSGEALYVGGLNFIDRFDGSNWSSLAVTGSVEALHVYDDGNGRALFVGGEFTQIGEQQAEDLARFDGSWSSLPLDFPGNGAVLAFETYGAGSAARLIVGGRFGIANGTTFNNIASWDGVAFSPLGLGVESIPGAIGIGVLALKSYEGGGPGPPGLYVGGRFLTAGGLESANWARWSGGTWHGLPAGAHYETQCFAVVSQPGGSSLYVGGSGSLFEWDGASLASLADDLTIRPLALEPFDDGSGEQAILGSESTGINGTLHGIDPAYLTSWDGPDWTAIDPGNGICDGVNVIATYDFGVGPELVAAGKFAAPGTVAAPMISRFDGQTWAPLGNNFSGYLVGALCEYDDGTGTQLYATGLITVDSQEVSLARFNGDQWQGIGTGFGGSSNRGLSMISYDDGSGQQLFLGGQFAQLDGADLKALARWDGTTWTQVGGGLDGASPYLSVVDMVTFDDGNGEALYVAGNFDSADSIPANNIAGWDGTTWSPLGAGLEYADSFTPVYIFDLEVYQSPTGPVLVAAGRFDVAGGAPIEGVAMWDGSSWSALGSGLDGDFLYGRSLKAFDPNDQGELLYVTGRFESAGGLLSGGAAVWDGTDWTSTFEIGNDGDYVAEMLVFDDGEGRALYLAGGFDKVAGIPSMGIARLSDPCGPDLGIPYCTSLVNSVGLRGLMRADGSASVAAANLTLVVSQLPPNKPVLIFHGPQAANFPFGDGLRCIAGGIQRIQPVGISDAQGTHSITVNYGASYATDFVAGNAIRFQGWYRDPTGGPGGFNTTDGLEIALKP
ncbi:MAG: hypothetical protein ACI8X5_001800 [Planctomycetota bacterium]|jgi:hypothetical protein